MKNCLKNNILISGITGFVGTNLKFYLQEKNFAVVGVSRIANEEKSIISYSKCDINEFNQAGVFIHLAGKAHDLKKVATDRIYFEANTNLTKSLFDKWLQSNCGVFIFMSSVKAVTDKVDEILDENEAPNPQTAYGKSKLAAEEYILSKQIPNNKRVYILRPCMIHGPNNKGNLNLLYEIINKGIPYPLGAFKNKRSFLSIDNLCFIIKKLIDLKPFSGVYNVSDDKAISTNDLVRIICESLERKQRIIYVPKNLIKILAKIGDLLPIPLNSEKLEKLTESFQVSNSKIKKAISVELNISTEEGLKKTLNSFKK